MERDRLEHGDVALDRERIPADEEVLVALEAVHRVAGTDSGEPFVRLDEDDRGLEGSARLRIPGSEKRRVEVDRAALEANARDLHARRKKGFCGSPRIARSSSNRGRP